MANNPIERFRITSPDKTLKLIELDEDDRLEKQLFNWLTGIFRHNIDLTDVK